MSKAKPKVIIPPPPEAPVVDAAITTPDITVLSWVAPFPAPEFDAHGADKILVRALVVRDLSINGHLLRGGVETVLPCSVAHAHASALAAPKK